MIESVTAVVTVVSGGVLEVGKAGLGGTTAAGE